MWRRTRYVRCNVSARCARTVPRVLGARALDPLLALCRCGIAPLLAQHLAALGWQLLKAAVALPDPRLLTGWELLEPLPA